MKMGGTKRGIIGKVIWGIIFAFLAFFFIRTAIWEYDYYNEKEGSVRATTESSTVEEPEQLDETEVTEEQRAEYFVAPDRPRYLSIEKLSIKNARVLPMNLKSSGELNTPNNIFDVGWYESSGKPGEGKTLLIDGHNGGPNIVGVFKYTPELVEGDIITIERGDGEIFRYSVVENISVPLSESDEYMKTAMISPVQGKESITLITCTGEWSQSRQTYLSRQFTRGVIIE